MGEGWESVKTGTTLDSESQIQYILIQKEVLVIVIASTELVRDGSKI